jgi:hypothetical protein
MFRAPFSGGSFVVGYGFGVQVMSGNIVNRYGMCGFFALGEITCSVRAGFRRIFCPFLVQSFRFFVCHVRNDYSFGFSKW